MINLNYWHCDENAKSLSYFARTPSVSLSKKMITDLKEKSISKGCVNVRLCLHRNPDENLHDMIILQYRNQTCKKPHKHLNKNETLHVIEGDLTSLIFHEDGELVKEVFLTPEDNLLYRIQPGLYHTCIPRTNLTIYRETKQGPFEPQDNVLPEWDHVKILKKYLPQEILDCENKFCKDPCGLNLIKNSPQKFLIK